MSRLYSVFLIIILLMSISCRSSVKEPDSEDSVSVGNVTIQKEEDYYLVTIDMTQKYSHKQTGQNYGKAILQTMPDFEATMDSYMVEISQGIDFEIFLKRINDIKGSLPEEYTEEIEGMAEVLSGTENVLGDSKLTKDEVYFLSLIPDIIRETQCSAFSVFGDFSATQSTVTGRNLDWHIGQDKQMAKIHAVTVIKNKDKSICLIGTLGYLGCITGFNNDKVFAAILDCSTKQPYSSENKRSYVYDLRYALENETSLEDVGAHMADMNKKYAFNHLIFLSDENESKVLENNFSGTGAEMKRALRSYDSKLNQSISWGFNHSVGAVNSFILHGNHDNHTKRPGNSERWKSLMQQISEKAEDGITYDELKEIISFDNGDGPGKAREGDLYSALNVQTILFQPNIFKLEVAFAPADSNLPTDPIFKIIFTGNPF